MSNGVKGDWKTTLEGVNINSCSCEMNISRGNLGDILYILIYYIAPTSHLITRNLLLTYIVYQGLYFLQEVDCSLVFLPHVGGRGLQSPQLRRHSDVLLQWALVWTVQYLGGSCGHDSQKTV